MITETAPASLHEVAAPKPAEPAAVSTAPQATQAEDPAVVVSVTGASAAPFEPYRASSSAVDPTRAAEEAAQEWSAANTLARVVHVPPPPIPLAPSTVAGVSDAPGSARPTPVGAPEGSSPAAAETSSTEARADARRATADASATEVAQPARAAEVAPAPAPGAPAAPAVVEAPTRASEQEVVRTATAKPPDAEGPPNRSVSAVQVELAGAAAQAAQPAAPQVGPPKKAQKAEVAVQGTGQANAVEKVQANARKVVAIKGMMEYMRYEQNRWKGPSR